MISGKFSHITLAYFKRETVHKNMMLLWLGPDVFHGMSHLLGHSSAQKPIFFSFLLNFLLTTFPPYSFTFKDCISSPKHSLLKNRILRTNQFHRVNQIFFFPHSLVLVYRYCYRGLPTHLVLTEKPITWHNPVPIRIKPFLYNKFYIVWNSHSFWRFLQQLEKISAWRTFLLKIHD